MASQNFSSRSSTSALKSTSNVSALRVAVLNFMSSSLFTESGSSNPETGGRTRLCTPQEQCPNYKDLPRVSKRIHALIRRKLHGGGLWTLSRRSTQSAANTFLWKFRSWSVDRSQENAGSVFPVFLIDFLLVESSTRTRPLSI